MLNSVNKYFFISPYNSVRFAECVAWDNYSKPKTVNNTLSYQEEGINTKDFAQLFQFNDAIRTQFKSSYASHTVKIKDSSGTIVKTVDLMKRTANLNVSDYRTAMKTAIIGNKLAVFFGGFSVEEGGDRIYDGNVLNELTDEVISPYNLGIYVPNWMKEGKNVEVEGYGELTIQKVEWIESFNRYALIFDTENLVAVPQDVKVKSVYNKQEYEVYEFDVDFYSLTEGKYQIEVLATDPTFGEVTHLSEFLHLKDYHENTHLFISSNSKNNQINYLWGIQHMMRLQYETQLKYSPDGEVEIHKTDNNTYLLNGTTYENYEVELSPLPTGMAIKTTMFLALNQLFVDTRSYVTSAKPTVEKLGDSNLYDYKIKLVLSNNDYNNKNADFSTIANVNLEFLDTGNGFLKSEDGMLVIN